MKKTVSRVLVLLLVAAMLLIQLPVSAAPETAKVSIQDGMTLHCWKIFLPSVSGSSAWPGMSAIRSPVPILPAAV